MPGWTATIDGRDTPIHPAKGIFQAVEVPAGSHRVTFGYSPPSVGWGELAFLVGVAALLAPPGLRRLTRRRIRVGSTTTAADRDRDDATRQSTPAVT